MTKRPSLRELLGVWLVGAVGEILAYYLVEDAAEVLTASVVAVGSVFLLTPFFLVVYSVVWAWPLAARGDRAAISALFLFAVVVEATAGWFWVALDAITNTTVMMRLLAVVSPVGFGACAASAAWAYRRRASSYRSAVMGGKDPADQPVQQRAVGDLDVARRGPPATSRRLNV